MQYLQYATESKYLIWSQILSHLYTYGFKVTAVYFCEVIISLLVFNECENQSPPIMLIITGHFLTTAVISQKKNLKN